MMSQKQNECNATTHQNSQTKRNVAIRDNENDEREREKIKVIIAFIHASSRVDLVRL